MNTPFEIVATDEKDARTAEVIQQVLKERWCMDKKIRGHFHRATNEMHRRMRELTLNGGAIW